MLKLLLLLYADDIVFFSKPAEGLQKGLHILKDYCEKWKMIINTSKTKIMVFRKGVRFKEIKNLNIMVKILKLSKFLAT